MTTTRAAGDPMGRTFLGRPRWFATLFMVDIWERFSFYGMTAILYLYLAAPTEGGGFGMDGGAAAAVFGLYMASMFLAALPGGWLADRVLGPRRAVAVGAVTIALGHYAMAVPARPFLFVGLVLVVTGTGLVKPAISWLVSQPDRGDAERREATFSLFYMSIQVSALIAPLVTGFLGERVNWHLGFGAAALGMTFGVAQYLAGARRMGDLGVAPPDPVDPLVLRRVLRRTALWTGVPVALVAVDVLSGLFVPQHLLMLLGLALVAVPVVAVFRLRRNPALDAGDRRRLRTFVWLMLASAVFWALYAQSGSVLSGFARDDIDRVVFGLEVPASWFQSTHPLFVLFLAPVFAWLWPRLGERASAPVKFGGALVVGGISWLILGSAVAAEVDRVHMGWLLLAYALLAMGELTIGPVGLALAARVAPEGMTNRYLGLFWVFAAVGAGLGGQLAQAASALPLAQYFLLVGVAVGAVGCVLLAVARSLRAGLHAPNRRTATVR
ncbi:peptide MFS transporter [Amycolatopsis arida]|nr:peptide MFS transporter [Amycolatopsis arida]